MSWSDVALLLVLILAPLLGPFLSMVYSLLSDETIPPLIPQLQSFAFGQSVVALTTLLVVGPYPSSRGGGLYLLLLVVLFLIILVQAVIFGRQRTKTREHIARTVLDRDRVHLRPEVDIAVLTQIGYSAVPVDFFPRSLAMRMSDSQASKRRQLFIDLINLMSTSPARLTPDDLLVPEPSRRTINQIYAALALMSSAAYVATICLSVTPSQG
jgi:hypothetical protein